MEKLKSLDFYDDDVGETLASVDRAALKEWLTTSGPDGDLPAARALRNAHGDVVNTLLDIMLDSFGASVEDGGIGRGWLSARGRKGRTVLLAAVRGDNYTELIQRIMDELDDDSLWLQDDSQETAFTFACRCSANFEVADLLLARCSAKHFLLQNCIGETPLTCSLSEWNGDAVLSAMERQASLNDEERALVERALMLKDHNGYTAIHQAVRYSRSLPANTAERILTLNPLILKVQSLQGRTALHVLAGLRTSIVTEEHLQLLGVLLRYADRATLHLRDSNGETATELCHRNCRMRRGQGPALRERFRTFGAPKGAIEA